MATDQTGTGDADEGEISYPGDPNEQEADATADEIADKLDIDIKEGSLEGKPERDATRGILGTYGRRIVELRMKYSGEPPRQAVTKGTSADEWLTRLYEQANDAMGPLSTVSRDVAILTGGNAKKVEIKDQHRASADAARDYGGNVDRMIDIVEGAILYDGLDLLYTALETIDKTQADHGLEILRVRDRIVQPGADGRRDVLLYVRLANGHIGVFRLALSDVDLYLTATAASHGDSVRAMETTAEQTPAKAFTPADAAAIDALKESEDADITGLFVKAWDTSQATT